MCVLYFDWEDYHLAELTGRRLLFVEEYLKDNDGAGAVRRAGYSTTDKSAKVQARRLLKDPSVKAEIARRQTALVKRAQIDQDRITRELYNIVNADIRDIITWEPCDPCPDCLRTGYRLHLVPSKDIPASAARCIKSVREDAKGGITVQLYDKVSAAGRLADILGLSKSRDEETAAGALSRVLVELWQASITTGNKPTNGGPSNGYPRVSSETAIDVEPILPAGEEASPRPPETLSLLDILGEAPRWTR
jgi:hypothetical protein